jgi:hypothetical protein
MKRILLLFLCLFSYATGFSQSEKLIHGKVSYQDNYQKDIDVINFNTKKLTRTNTAGEFSIEAKVGDALIFMSENFADQKHVLTQEDFDKNVVTIKVVEKPIPLKEVEITQVKAIRLAGISYNEAKIAKIEKDATRPKNKDVYTGEIENGVDFIQVGKLIGKLFKSKKPKTEKPVATLPFKEYAKANFNESFFTKTLKLQPAETSRFLEYCQADPQSKTVIEKNDELTMLEFLLAKKTEFDKLK